MPYMIFFFNSMELQTESRVTEYNVKLVQLQTSSAGVSELNNVSIAWLMPFSSICIDRQSTGLIG